MPKCAVQLNVGRGPDIPASGPMSIQRLERGDDGELLVAAAAVAVPLKFPDSTVHLEQGVVYRFSEGFPGGVTRTCVIPALAEAKYSELEDVDYIAPTGGVLGDELVSNLFKEDTETRAAAVEFFGETEGLTDEFVAGKVADPASATGSALSAKIGQAVQPTVDGYIAANPTIDSLVAAIGAKTITRTNLHPTPKFATLTGWSAAGATLSIPETGVMRITATGTGAFTANGITIGAVTPGEKLLAMHKRRGNASRMAYMRMTWTGGTPASNSGWNGVNTTSEWVRYGHVFTVPEGTTAARLDVLIAAGGSSGSEAGAIGHYVEVTELFVERGTTLPAGGVTNTANLPTYFDGDTPDDATHEYAWTGTPGQSTSTYAVWTPPAPEVTGDAVATALAEPAPKAVLDAQYTRALLTLTPEHIIQQEFVRSKGGHIGTNGKAAVALRFDHWLNKFGSVVLPLLRARSIPVGLCVWSSIFDAPWVDANSNNYTWADVQNWCIEDGVEIWCHSRSHAWNDTWGEAGLVEEIVNSKAAIEAAMPKVKVQGWMQPGTGENPTYLGEFDSTKIDAFYASRAGALLRQTYAVAETDATSGGYRQLPTGPLHGAGHATTDTSTLANMIAHVDRAIARGQGLEFMTHVNLDQPGFNTTADFTAFLDYLAAKRDEGVLDIVTPSGLYVADPTRATRADLIAGGDFTGFHPVTSPGMWVPNSEAVRDATSVGDDGGTPYMAISSAGSFWYQTHEQVSRLGFEGETFRWTADFRRADSATAATARIQLYNPTTGTSWSRVMDEPIPAGTGWTRRTGLFTIPKGVPYFRMYAGRAPGGGGGVHMKNVHAVKV